MNGLDLFLQDQPAKALDRILWVGLFLDRRFDLAAADAAILVQALGRPLHGADTALAGGSDDAGPRRDDSDLERLVLRDGRREYGRCCGGEHAGTGEFGKIATRQLHWKSLPWPIAHLPCAVAIP